MIIHNRHISSTESKTCDWRSSQASINSSGCLCLRKYNPDDSTNDEILIFTKEETDAIIALFREICNSKIASSLPF